MYLILSAGYIVTPLLFDDDDLFFFLLEKSKCQVGKSLIKSCASLSILLPAALGKAWCSVYITEKQHSPTQACLSLHQCIPSVSACCCFLFRHLKTLTWLLFIMMAIRQVTYLQIWLEISANTLPSSSFSSSPSRTTLSVIDRKAERRLLASKDSLRKPLCSFEVLIDAIMARIGIQNKFLPSANLLWFIFQEQ